MKKIILWSLVSLVVVGAAIGAYLWLNRPQVIQLSDGTKLTLLGVEYGTHHKYPTSKVKGAHRAAQSFDTAEKSVIVWILQEHKPNQWPNFQTLVYDRADTACVGNWSGNSQQIKPGEEIMGLELRAFPRRNSKFILRFQAWGRNGQKIEKEQFVVSNPARSSAPQWTASAPPLTQSDGDLDVTLTRLVSGVPGFGNGLSKDPSSKGVLAAFHIEQGGTVVTNWHPIQITSSDATGNQIQNNSTRTGSEDNGDPNLTYQWGLWPAENAWKLKVEMSRTSGFADDELFTVTDLPINAGSRNELWGYGDNNRRKTNSEYAETTLDGIHLKIYPALRLTDGGGGDAAKEIGFRISTNPDVSTNGYRLTLVKVADENGRKFQDSGSGWGGGTFTYQFRDPHNAKTLNLMIALHKSRFVEFTARPSEEK